MQEELNEAKRTEIPIQDHRDCELCMEHWLFHMKDMHHEFYIGLKTILECLDEAIDSGAIPQPPNSWFIDIQNRMY